MLWNARNGSVRIDDTVMSFVSFGYGEKPLVILPGLSDGLMTVSGKALMLANSYKRFFDKYTVYMFSRKNCRKSIPFEGWRGIRQEQCRNSAYEKLLFWVCLKEG